MLIKSGITLDDGENIFFSRQLTEFETEILKIEYPDASARRLFPIKRSQNPDAERIIYQQRDAYGKAAVVAPRGGLITPINFSASEFARSTRMIMAKATFTKKEIRQAARLGMNLEMDAASEITEILLRTESDVIFSGASALQGVDGFTGVLTNTDVIVDTVAGVWSGATAATILAEMHEISNVVGETTLGVHQADTLVLALEQYNQVARTPWSSNSDTTILMHFMANTPYIKEVTWSNELKDAGGTGNDGMIAYKRADIVVANSLVQDVHQVYVEEDAFCYHVYYGIATAGVVFKRPKGFARFTGL